MHSGVSTAVRQCKARGAAAWQVHASAAHLNLVDAELVNELVKGVV